MALRNHTLDDKIITAARTEFLEKGYQAASLRKIAEKAGVTVGAIQTRYKSKDELFGSLLKPFLDEVETLFQNTRVEYYADTDTDVLAGLKVSMRHESAAILHLIFDHYDEAVLLLCRSGGSGLEHCFDGIVQSKINESVLFFHKTGFAGIDEKLLGLLIAAQFDSYRRIVAECPDRKTAERYMDALMVYYFGGWSAFFESTNISREGD
jgi:AcrR family transcriptional regulator